MCFLVLFSINGSAAIAIRIALIVAKLNCG